MDKNDKKSKVAILFSVIMFLFIFFLFAVSFTVFTERSLPTLLTSKVDIAKRGNIISAEGISLASSRKLYKVTVHSSSIEKDKRELFIKLFSIYSGMEEDSVREKLDSKYAYVTLTYGIDESKARDLKTLAYILDYMRVFRNIEDPKTSKVLRQSLNVIESGEKRDYFFDDILTPVIGYVRKKDINGLTEVYGDKGIEKYYEEKLEATVDALWSGYRDVNWRVIFDKSATIQNRVDGANVQLTVPIYFQKLVENVLDYHKERVGAKEIIASVMESSTGRILALATTNRYNPNKITDTESLNSKAVEFSFEIGSVMKPIIYSLLLEHNRVNPNETINVYGGKYKLGENIITDTKKANFLDVEHVIIYSSNIGMAQISQRLDTQSYFQGLLDFGFASKTGIDLPYESIGSIPKLTQLKDEVYKATVSYGYGMHATFMQLLKAYNVFNNEGAIVTPRLTDYLEFKNGGKHQVFENQNIQIISANTANRVKNTLIKTVEQGTGINARVEGIEIGGKTGTSHISEGRGGYGKRYISSFFGFANDKESKYTIGVTVIEPSKFHFASQSAAPAFKDIVKHLINSGYLYKGDGFQTIPTNHNIELIED